ncbi:MAG: hypothetical protein JKY10_08665 [Cohaesibacteraceae bacterium]|nr:hypothetical protein [Cohaesibacteraceae bacterium]
MKTSIQSGVGLCTRQNKKSSLAANTAVFTTHTNDIAERQYSQLLLSMLQSSTMGPEQISGRHGAPRKRQRKTTISVVWLQPIPTHRVMLM